MADIGSMNGKIISPAVNLNDERAWRRAEPKQLSTPSVGAFGESLDRSVIDGGLTPTRLAYSSHIAG